MRPSRLHIHRVSFRPGGSMHRRDALRIFAASAVLPVFSPELFALFRQAQPPPGYTLRTLTPQLNELVLAMIDQIIPATDTPGAKGARAFSKVSRESIRRASNCLARTLPKLLLNSNLRNSAPSMMQLSRGAPVVRIMATLFPSLTRN